MYVYTLYKAGFVARYGPSTRVETLPGRKRFIIQGLRHVSQDFTFSPVLYGKPMKLLQNWCYVIIARRSVNKTCLKLSLVHQSEEHCNSYPRVKKIFSGII